MQLNWSGYQYRSWDGYGRYSLYMIRALLKAGVEVNPVLEGVMDMPAWLLAHTDTHLDGLTISCLPPYYLRSLPKRGPGIVSTRHWLLTMTEGSECPDGWADIINKSDVERVIVPCEHNAAAFRSGGVQAPITVIPGGTDPCEFALRTCPRACTEQSERNDSQPYTFLALADRGARKGWMEVYAAFFKAFGGRNDTADVRLIVKCRPEGNDLIDLLVTATNPDPRITWQVEDVADVAQVYAQADCVVIPSRSEGWGMPHREAAMMGIPVITQAYSGMDDGHTHEWAALIEGGNMEPIPSEAKHIKGHWRVVDVDELAGSMRACYENPSSAERDGWMGARWLRANQTWAHSAQRLIDLMKEQGAWH